MVAMDNIGMKSQSDIDLFNGLVRFLVKSKIEKYMPKIELDILIVNRSDLKILPLKRED